MKSLKKLIALLLVITSALLLLASCGKSEVDNEGNMTVVIESSDGTYKEYNVPLDKLENYSEGLVGALEYLSRKKVDPLSLDMSDSTYGKYIHSIGAISEDPAKGRYVIAYTSVEKDFSTYEGVNTIKYEGVTLKTSGVGISSMSVKKDSVILFRLETYQ